MIIYWRIGKFVLGLYLIFQFSLWIAYQFPTAPEVIQEAGETLLNRHLHQHLPEYYSVVNGSTEVRSLLASKSEVEQLLDTLLPGALYKVLDSSSISKSAQPQWLEVAYQNDVQSNQSGWIVTSDQ